MSSEGSPKRAFIESLDRLATLGGWAIHVSMNQNGLPATQAEEMSSMAFAKMCAHTRSLGAICQSSMFDHSAMMALSRMIVESTTMIAYLRQPISEEEWRFRYLLLGLHDTTSRIKLLRDQRENGTDDLRQGRAALVAEMSECPAFNRLAPDRKKRLLTGEECFTFGMRKAVELMGWNGDTFTSWYSYLSTHTHSTPTSFIRARSFNLDYYNPSEMQYSMAVIGIEIAVACVARTVIRIIDAHPEQLSKYHPGLLSEWRQEDVSTAVFGGSGRCDIKQSPKDM